MLGLGLVCLGFSGSGSPSAKLFRDASDPLQASFCLPGYEVLPRHGSRVWSAKRVLGGNHAVLPLHSPAERESCPGSCRESTSSTPRALAAAGPAIQARSLPESCCPIPSLVRPVSIPLSAPPHPLPVSLSETLAFSLPVALVLACLAHRPSWPAVGPLRTPPAAILAVPLVRTVPECSYHHFRRPDRAIPHSHIRASAGRAEQLRVAGVGLRFSGR